MLEFHLICDQFQTICFVIIVIIIIVIIIRWTVTIINTADIRGDVASWCCGIALISLRRRFIGKIVNRKLKGVIQIVSL